MFAEIRVCPSTRNVDLSLVYSVWALARAYLLYYCCGRGTRGPNSMNAGIVVWARAAQCRKMQRGEVRTSRGCMAITRALSVSGPEALSCWRKIDACTCKFTPCSGHHNFSEWRTPLNLGEYRQDEELDGRGHRRGRMHAPGYMYVHVHDIKLKYVQACAIFPVTDRRAALHPVNRRAWHHNMNLLNNYEKNHQNGAVCVCGYGIGRRNICCSSEHHRSPC